MKRGSLRINEGDKVKTKQRNDCCSHSKNKYAGNMVKASEIKNLTPGFNLKALF